MGIFTPSDLLLLFPDKYIFTDGKIEGDIREGDEVSFFGIVKTPAQRQFIRRGLTVVTCVFENNGVTVRCSWFNQPYAARNLKPGDSVYVFGKVKQFKRVLQLTNPTLVTPREGDGAVIPVYKTAIPSATFASAVQTALACVRVNSYIPKEIAEKYGLMPLQTALSVVHAPENRARLATARRSLAIENLCYVITSYRLLKDDGRDFAYNAPTGAVERFCKALPYELTPDQKKAIDEIISGMRSDKLLNILVQGEVGCGKTVVALCAMYYAAMSGYQSVIMTPTEVLARQHCETMIRLLEPLGVRTQLLCASMTKQQRDVAMFNIKYGVTSCIVGTQALLGEYISFDDLRLVIVDEQQRFGVNQRAKLENKGKKTDMIVMTATPIPRTLALSLYGELKQILIRSRPANRPTVHTAIVPPSKIKGMYNYIRERAALDERTYIICPRIEDSDDELTGVQKLYDELKASPLGAVSGCVHGKMRDSEKNEIMNAFKTGQIKVLVSTTVVEVGIDVPEATTVVIYDAERYGLAQLHQMRGRVGRGTKESYCFLVSENGTPESDARLREFCGMTDGFAVSELDFKLRGAGDFVGLRQHGNGSPEIDERIIEKARAISDAIIADGRTSESILRSLKSPEFIRSVTMN